MKKISWLCGFIFFTCSDLLSQRIGPIDKNATLETLNLFHNLKKLSKKHILFGHQWATANGHRWSGDSDRSDVKSVTGSHPAIVGVDFSGFTTNGADTTKRDVKKIVEDTYNRGGVVTVAWHFLNPVSAGDYYWKDSVSLPAVQYIIPGGEAHRKYKAILKDIAEWANNVCGADGKAVPMIFRPYHEFDGDWFWWGAKYCTKEEFISLWRFTVTYLRDSLHVHNFLYAFSPDNLYDTENEYLERYPGDEWVDMLGMDNYGDMGRDRYAPDAAVKKLKIISDYAKKFGKLAAFTETGLLRIPNVTWWTETFLKVLKTPDLELCYALVWTNNGRNPDAYYAPFPGQVSVPDFIKFYEDPFTFFEKDLKDIYKKK